MWKVEGEMLLTDTKASLPQRTPHDLISVLCDALKNIYDFSYVHNRQQLKTQQ
jgi:hypothetical protein